MEKRTSADDGQPADASTWERVREALRRDWEQTKHHIDSSSGHEYNQTLADTLKQAMGAEEIPPDDAPNPPKVIGTWEEADRAIRFGHEANGQFKDSFPRWNGELENVLARVWYLEQLDERTWHQVRGLVQHGYELRDAEVQTIGGLS